MPLPPLATGKTPVAWLTGTLVAFVRLTADGVPKLGVIITGDVNNPATVTFLVVVPWTRGKTSVPPKGVVAAGSWEILTLDMI